MNSFRSIRWHLQAWHGLLLAVILVGLGTTAYYFERAHQLEQMDRELQQLAAKVANSARSNPGRSPQRSEDPPPGRPNGNFQPQNLRLSPEDAASFAPGGGYFYAIWLKNGPSFTASPDAPPGIPRPEGSESGLRSRSGFREAYLSPAPDDVIVVGTSEHTLAVRRAQMAWTLIAGGTGIYVMALLVGSWFIGRSLQPIAAISLAAADIARGDLSRRIDTRDTESELGQLTQILNATFARLDDAFSRQARFTADAAHELRTPVTVLLTHIQNVLAAEDLSSENRDALDACQRAAQRMRRLIDSLLLLARFDNGEGHLQQSACDLSQSAADAVELTRVVAEARGVTVKTDCSPAPVMADPDRITQVIANLLANACQHSEENTEVSIRTGRDGDSAVCEIRDEGPGISASHLPHIFERFYRVDRARTGTSGRTGLGLAISLAISKAHGGSIEAGSIEGHGTTFTLRLPLRPPPRDQAISKNL